MITKKDKEAFRKLASKFVGYYEGNITKATFIEMCAWIERDGR